MKKIFFVYVLLIFSGLIISSCSNSDQKELTPKSAKNKTKSKANEANLPQTIEDMEAFLIENLNKRISLSQEQIDKIKSISKDLQANQAKSGFGDVKAIRKLFRKRIKRDVLTEEQVSTVFNK